MLIYRVEHGKNGHGPYVIDQKPYVCECSVLEPQQCDVEEYYWEIVEFADLLCGEHSNDDHPTPRSIPYWKICGFESIEALRAWFDGFEDMLDHYGYVIATYTYAETVMADDYGQVTFEKDTANRLTTEKI